IRSYSHRLPSGFILRCIRNRILIFFLPSFYASIYVFYPYRRGEFEKDAKKHPALREKERKRGLNAE
ncbi:MAG: hypothetical protein KJ002_12240, partial [Candidatus Dadabacteria bacterium]|nr:hypothetical protein [Candidatus Dadabacteria bacterium]